MAHPSLISAGRELIEVLVASGELEARPELEEELEISSLAPPDFLVSEGADPHQVLTHWGMILGVEPILLSEAMIDASMTRKIPESLARKLELIPISGKGQQVVVCMVDPLDVHAIDRVRFLTGLEVRPMVGLASDISEAISKHYAVDAAMEQAYADAAKDEEAFDELVDEEQVLAEAEHDANYAAPVVRIVNLILNQALKDRASDIHIEPDQGKVRVRYRIDGLLQDRMSPPGSLYGGIVTRIKVLSNLDIAERRVPQDGQFSLDFRTKHIDFRVNTLPTIQGEKIVLRVLDSSKVQVSLDSLGFTPEVLRTWRDLIRLPSGVILVTGPTGSGKTTTLYGSLHEINIPEANISTLEDPVEYKLPRVQQVQVNPRTNMTFAAGLRALLRQDPDIIMVGEIRDLETADMAIRAAHTGHLVFSTLHTNEAASTVVRLTHMGVEPFMIAGSVRAILAQRLLRRLCRGCRVEEKPDPALLRRLVGSDDDPGPFYAARGCDHCRQSGYFGRVGVYELMVVSEPLRQKMMDNVGLAEIRAAAQGEGMITLRDDAIAKARKGVTSLDEVSRVAMVSS